MNGLSGRARWKRINPASAPPARKKPNAVAMYRLPIDLWLTDVSQAHTPCPSSHVRSSSASVVSRFGGSSREAVSIDRRAGIAGVILNHQVDRARNTNHQDHEEH